MKYTVFYMFKGAMKKAGLSCMAAVNTFRKVLEGQTKYGRVIAVY